MLAYQCHILGNTETKIINNSSLMFDITIKGYKHFFTTTGKAALRYVNCELNSKSRQDLD